MKACQRDLSANLDKVELRVFKVQKAHRDVVRKRKGLPVNPVPPEVLRGEITPELEALYNQLREAAGLPPLKRSIVALPRGGYHLRTAAGAPSISVGHGGPVVPSAVVDSGIEVRPSSSVAKEPAVAVASHGGVDDVAVRAGKKQMLAKKKKAAAAAVPNWAQKANRAIAVGGALLEARGGEGPDSSAAPTARDLPTHGPSVPAAISDNGEGGDGAEASSARKGRRKGKQQDANS